MFQEPTWSAVYKPRSFPPVQRQPAAPHVPRAPCRLSHQTWIVAYCLALHQGAHAHIHACAHTQFGTCFRLWGPCVVCCSYSSQPTCTTAAVR